ncbi:MAG: gamma carbonic anhydrase family protein [Sphingomonadaceae bacterium]|uniref:gamma carbonic anhydrase family protein n=1 Tax=Thermaurantiacus sp. TaxID=2820283 RepID=UPI00298EDF1F|nr:gamma carbonic anhydrase family protein [Thermaurantiacus sp.]MCS6987219.1 gamma carbonic anhydrase family protein [Sphingomonadaceae bacterium]MDW8414439.1 gamma carbonic anhydrase family protein [Thermaurantiacus sp.]
MPLLPFMDARPEVDPTAWIAPTATVIGQVTIGPDASVWYNCVLRGDVMPIVVGARSNIQDGTVVHVTRVRARTEIGADVLVGHACVIHGCTLMDRAFVGLGAIVMDGCVVEPDGMLAAGALLPPGKRVGTRELWAGRPARLVRTLSDEEVARNRAGAAGYVELARRHRASLGG